MSPQASRAQQEGQSNGGAADSIDAASKAYATALFDTAEQLHNQYEKLLKARTANRVSLRNMEAQGHLSDEQVKRLNEVYPERQLSDEAIQRREERKQKRAAEKARKAEEAKRQAA